MMKLLFMQAIISVSVLVHVLHAVGIARRVGPRWTVPHHRNKSLVENIQQFVMAQTYFQGCKLVTSTGWMGRFAFIYTTLFVN